jgi:hypothetical protein
MTKFVPEMDEDFKKLILSKLPQQKPEKSSNSRKAPVDVFEDLADLNRKLKENTRLNESEIEANRKQTEKIKKYARLYEK